MFVANSMHCRQVNAARSARGLKRYVMLRSMHAQSFATLARSHLKHVCSKHVGVRDMVRRVVPLAFVVPIAFVFETVLSIVLPLPCRRQEMASPLSNARDRGT